MCDGSKSREPGRRIAAAPWLDPTFGLIGADCFLQLKTMLCNDVISFSLISDIKVKEKEEGDHYKEQLK